MQGQPQAALSPAGIRFDEAGGYNMEWNLGVEMRNEYRRMELARAAMKLVRDIMLCKPGENLVITYDTGVDERVVHALTEAAYTIDTVPTVV